MNQIKLLCAGICALLAIGCAAKPMDRTAYLAHMPSSILVLPPINHTADVGASDAFMATITEPLAERGYYVFPIPLVDQFMKENGLPTPGDMHQAPLNKLSEVFGTDAVLYIDILSWETQYAVVDSSTRVRMSYRLVDVKSGLELWKWQQMVIQSSSAGQTNLIGMMVSAAVHQATAGIERERMLAATANHAAIENEKDGMLLGRRHPMFEKDQRKWREQQKAQ